jgi:hypothetical protein
VPDSPLSLESAAVVLAVEPDLSREKASEVDAGRVVSFVRTASLAAASPFFDTLSEDGFISYFAVLVLSLSVTDACLLAALLSCSPEAFWLLDVELLTAMPVAATVARAAVEADVVCCVEVVVGVADCPESDVALLAGALGGLAAPSFAESPFAASTVSV